MNDRGVPLLEKLGAGGSARIWPLIAADGLASIPAEQGELPSMSPIDYYPFSSAFTL
jgi:molybdopterin molybdotransferase